MIRIGLDLATNTCGIAIIDRLPLNDKFIGKDTLSIGGKMSPIDKQLLMVSGIWERIKNFSGEGSKLIFEDIYKGMGWENLKIALRTQGSIIQKWKESSALNEVEIVSPIIARNKLNIPVRAPKVEIQLWAIKVLKLKFLESNLEETITPKIKRYHQILKAKKKINKKEFVTLKLELEDYSNIVGVYAGLTEHEADALVLALN